MHSPASSRATAAWPPHANAATHTAARATPRCRGAIVLQAHAGSDSIRFQGALDGGSLLAPGAYQLTLGASDASGKTTAAQHPKFTLLPSSCRLPRRMSFFEYEAREIVKRAGIPVTDYGFTSDPAEAAQIAERIGGPTVIKSQVLTGGRMKAGGVKFADTPAEAESYARDILAAGDRRAHAARGAGRPQGRGQAGVLRRRRLGRHRASSR